MCSDHEELVLLTACVNLGLERISERILFPKKAFHILAHQVICICLQKFGATADIIWGILSPVSCFSQITRDDFNSLIAFMIQEDFLHVIDNNILVTGHKTETEFLRANWKRLFAIFDTGPMYNVVDGKKVIGTLDSGFARTQKLPFIFVLGGQEWDAVKIDHELQQLSVKKNETGIAPKWKAIANYDIPFELAQEVGRLLMNEDVLSFLDMPSKNILRMERNEHRLLNWEPGKWILDSSEDQSKVYLWSFSGEKINRGLSILLFAKFNISSTFDYKKINIDFGKEKPLSRNEIIECISSFKLQSIDSLEKSAQEQMDVKWFSKFSYCLPDSLAKQTICEKDYNVGGLLRELGKVLII